MALAMTLRNQRNINTWQKLVEGGAGHGNRLLEATHKALSAIDPPGLSWINTEVSPGFLQNMMGKRREFFVVGHDDMQAYRMYVSARDFGQNLQCSWFLTEKRGTLSRFMLRLSGKKDQTFLGLDIFDEQDLSAWVGTVHQVFLREVKALMQDLEQDASSLNATGKGYLSVW